MNVLQAIDSLHGDLDRTIESLEALREGFGAFALVAPTKAARPVELAPRAKTRVKQFVDECLDPKLRGISLWRAYQRCASSTT